MRGEHLDMAGRHSKSIPEKVYVYTHTWMKPNKKDRNKWTKHMWLWLRERHTGCYCWYFRLLHCRSTLPTPTAPTKWQQTWTGQLIALGFTVPATIFSATIMFSQFLAHLCSKDKNNCWYAHSTYFPSWHHAINDTTYQINCVSMRFKYNDLYLYFVWKKN